MVLALLGQTLLILALLVVHVRAKVVQLRLVEVRGQLGAGLDLDVLERGAQGGDRVVVLHAGEDDLLEVGHGADELGDEGGVVERVARRVLGVGRGGEAVVAVDRGEDLLDDEVGLDDAARAPDLQEGVEVDVEGFCTSALSMTFRPCTYEATQVR